jgi:ubiquinone/menaquinone biosynthesis C-methylase UbiE
MSYDSDFSNYYDLFYGQKSYDVEASFIDHVLQYNLNRQPPEIDMLELASGTGNHALCFAKLGYKILATDVSKSMLDKARQKLKSFSSIDFLVTNMTDIDSLEKKFSAVLCLFDSIGYLLTNDAVLKALKNVENVLAHDGIFIMEFWSAGAMLRSFDPIRERVYDFNEKKIKRISRTSLNYADQYAEVRYSVFEQFGTTSTLVTEETHRNRFFLIQEMNFMLQQAGLEVIKHYDGFSEGVPNENTWHVVSVCKKRI